MKPDKKIRILVGGIFLLNMVFLLFKWEPTKTYDLFLFSSMKTPLSAYVFHLCQKLSIALTWYLIASELIRYRFLFLIMAFFVIDVIDYILSYNSVWYAWGQFPISWNTVGAFMVFAGLFFVEER
jgi:hypothetical protein